MPPVCPKVAQAVAHDGILQQRRPRSCIEWLGCKGGRQPWYRSQSLRCYFESWTIEYICHLKEVPYSEAECYTQQQLRDVLLEGHASDAECRQKILVCVAYVWLT